MTPPGPDPPRTSTPPRYYGPAAWPVGFRGIGGHLIRPAPSEVTPAGGFAAHGAHLLSPIVPAEGSGRAAACPVCLTSATLPPSGGWVPVHCRSCGTEFVATDGSPPPAPPPPPRRVSPIAPPSPPEPRPADSALPRGFTSEVRTTADGRRRVTCPQCHRAELDVPRGATVAVVLRCPLCHGPFLVSLDGKSGPPVPPPPPTPAPAPSLPRPAPRRADPGPDETPVADIYGRARGGVAPCPKCGTHAAVPGAARGWVWFLCAGCGGRFKADSSAAPLPLSWLPPVLPPSPSPPPARPRAADAPRVVARREVFDRGRSAARCPYCGREGPVDHEPKPDRLVPTTCSSCGNIFVADLRLSLWGKIRRLFGG